MTELIYVVIFVVLFLVIKNTLESVNFLEKGNTALAVCVSLLCLVGMQHMFVTPVTPAVPPADTSGGRKIDFLLLPYATLGISIIFTLILAWFFRLSRRKKKKQLEDECKFYKNLSKGKSDNERLYR